MTNRSEQLDNIPGEILAALPEKTRKRLRAELGDIAESLGERWIGGPWLPEDDPEQCHTEARLGETAAQRVKDLAELLADLPEDVERVRIYLFLFLWQECWEFWDNYLIYRTLGVVLEAIEKSRADSGKSAQGVSTDDWELAALQAAGNAIRLISVDAAIFRQIVLSDPSELGLQADRGVEDSAEVIEEIGSVLRHLEDAGEGDCLAARGLRSVKQVTVENQRFYRFLAAAAKVLSGFHVWLAAFSPLRTSQSPGKDADGEDLSVPRSEDLLRSIDAVLGDFRSVLGRLGSTVLSRAEPWEQLLSEVREIIVQGNDAESAGRVFVPRRICVRYCYPFAVQTDEELAGKDEHTWLDSQLRSEDLIKDLRDQLAESLGIEVRDVRPFDPTAFFAARDSEVGLYGGVRVVLPDVELSTGHGSGQAARCKVWIVLSRMGNHCLCVEREAIEAPLPQIVYRALTAGTPSVLGLTATLVDDTDGTVAWDNLHSFSQDVIRAVASASFWCSRPHHYLRGNLHEVLIVQTDTPLATEPDGIAATLNSALGGRTLLKSTQRTPITADEWVRYAPVVQTYADSASDITALPELGLAGDWCAHTGETTVFGIVAAPSWHTAVYAEAAQFASSWSPLMRMWNRRLQEAVERASSGEENESQAKELRQIERTVRRHLVQIKSEELCATLAHRRFLDRLLEMSGVFRLQAEMESLLETTERLMAWWTEDARRKSDKLWRDSERQRQESEAQQRKVSERQNKLLGVIALFGMFELGGFLELGNATQWHQNIFGLFTMREGVWEDWVIVILFVTALTLAIRLGLFGTFSGLKGWLGRILPVRWRQAP